MASVFSGKNIVVGITGSIAAFKVAGWVSDLAKEESLVSVVMTESAKKFVTPLTFSALSGREVFSAMFDQTSGSSMAHIDLGREADLLVIAPATANTIAKLSAGLADDLLSTAVLAARCNVIIFPAMNSRMYAHPATQANILKLRNLGYMVVEPDCGTMACKEEGAGRLVEWDVAKEYLASALSIQDLKKERIVVTAGPTREAIDPARFLSNRSSGKMGFALARCARRRGAEVVLISGPSSIEPPLGVKVIKVDSAQEMCDATLEEAAHSSIVVKAAAVADYRPTTFSSQKVKKENIESNLTLAKNPDILYLLGQQKRAGQILVGFAAESQNLLAEGGKKLDKKNLDLIAVNDISSSQAGFEVDTNQVVLLDKKGHKKLPLTTKHHTADLILNKIIELREL
ncbi:MAG: bifunctional phosphopantothenoylcysteine decarboxylase/phosphopantothenate--cysteine ligase CoaBC [Desulfobulbaceae bacterium]|nr:bifunctional phosphopantothenoylcysteine decarboxylase/phosphopantothenate--cysteine ligase CoaBC [Desulfobulbaceae bacterium]